MNDVRKQREFLLLAKEDLARVRRRIELVRTGVSTAESYGLEPYGMARPEAVDGQLQAVFAVLTDVAKQIDLLIAGTRRP